MGNSMSGPLVECVPNFSEGKDRRKVDDIADSVASVAGVKVLDVTLDADHNRSVITFAGPPQAARAGAAVVGARKLLIAFNINLQTRDVALARAIAKKIRASSGGLPCVKALGVGLESRGLAQVSLNFTDFERTPVSRVFDEVKDLAA